MIYHLSSAIRMKAFKDVYLPTSWQFFSFFFMSSESALNNRIFQFEIKNHICYLFTSVFNNNNVIFVQHFKCCASTSIMTYCAYNSHTNKSLSSQDHFIQAFKITTTESNAWIQIQSLLSTYTLEYLTFIEHLQLPAIVLYIVYSV